MEDKKRTKFYVKGVGHINSIEEMSKKSGLPIQTILLKRGKGATDSQIFNNKRIVFFEVYGKDFLSMKEFIDHFDLKIKSATIENKLKKGATLEEVIEEERNGIKPDYYIKDLRCKKIILEDKEYDSFTEAYEAYKDDDRVTLEKGTIRQRYFTYGFTAEEAFFSENLKKLKVK